MQLYYLLIVPAILFGLYAQWLTSSNYSKYSQISPKNNLSGLDAAKKIIEGEKLAVSTQTIEGELTDNYNSEDNVMSLSHGNTLSSIASIAIVAHELGHACQDRDKSPYLLLRHGIGRFAAIGTNLGYIIILIGLGLQITGLSMIGLIFMSLAFIFTVVTLPVEFDASSRALKLIEKYNLLSADELSGARSVLFAAALTYVSATVSSLVQLLPFALQILSQRNRD